MSMMKMNLMPKDGKFQVCLVELFMFWGISIESFGWFCVTNRSSFSFYVQEKRR